MNKTNSTVVFMASILFGATLPLQAKQLPPSLVLFNFDKDFDISKVITNDAKVNLSQDGTLRDALRAWARHVSGGHARMASDATPGDCERGGLE